MAGDGAAAAVGLVRLVWADCIRVVRDAGLSPDARMLGLVLARNIATWDAGTGIVGATPAELALIAGGIRVEGEQAAAAGAAAFRKSKNKKIKNLSA